MRTAEPPIEQGPVAVPADYALAGTDGVFRVKQGTKRVACSIRPMARKRYSPGVRQLAPAALLLLVAASAFGAAPRPGDAAPPLAPEDIRGRTLVVPAAGHVMLLSFASRSTGEEAGKLARAMRLEHPELEILSFIDLSSFPRFARGMVRRQIEKRHESAVEATQAAFASAGKAAPADLDARIHIIPDWDAKSCQTYGASDAEKQPLIVVIGADGRVAALFAETPSLSELGAAVAKEIGSTRPP